MGRLVKLVGAGIGLTTEAIKSRQSPSSSGSQAAGASRSASVNAPRYSGDPTQSVDLPTDPADQQDDDDDHHHHHHHHHDDYDDIQDSEEHEDSVCSSMSHIVIHITIYDIISYGFDMI
ncbi:hypothetical protein V1521DRAFT_468160 [Lipomyces starkeyi]